MFRHAGTLTLSASDLAHVLACRHRSALDLAVALGRREPPPPRTDLLLDVLVAKGLAHEQAYVDALRAEGLAVADLSAIDSRDQAERLIEATLRAMRDGADVIVQGALRQGPWFGKPDILRRVPSPSALGGWSYEAVDTKLSRETRAGAVLQLSLYSAMLAHAQGTRPAHFHIVTPDPTRPVHSFRHDDYAAYLRQVQRRLLDLTSRDPDLVAAEHYPEPVEHCRVCRWAERCAQRRHDDDHLSLVAGIGRAQRRELEAQGLTTLTALAHTPLPFPVRPRRGSVETLTRLREQARVQLASRGCDVPRFELRPVVDGEGLCRLPPPSPGDIFLDLESDTFAAEGGRDYLFGVVTVADGYRAFWGPADRDERMAFEAVMDLIAAAWRQHPGMHVYHYAPHEPTAFKRLMGRYVTRERELDALLRHGRFVDLYAVVRQGLIVGTERYSIKNLEPLYGFPRTVPLAQANKALRRLEVALQLDAPDDATAEVREVVQGYNADDCFSTLRLREWLERVRAEHEADGGPIPRPVTVAVEEKPLDDHDQRVAALRARLLAGVPDARAERTADQQARWLLAFLLDYHRREAKASFWEYYRLKEMPEDELFDEPQAIADLVFVDRIDEKRHKKTGRPTGTVTDRYRYPAQEMEIEPSADLRLPDGRTLGKVAAVDRAAATVDIVKRTEHRDLHPPSVFSHTHIAASAQERSLSAIARRWTRDASADAAGRALLLAQPPAMLGASAVDPAEYLTRAVLALDGDVLPVQGPPGAGKTWCGGAMICALVAAGRRVGVAATSHKVIRNLLDSVQEAAVRLGTTISMAHKAGTDDIPDGAHVRRIDDNDEARRVIEDGEAQVLGGTAWLWSRENMAGAVDVLFVDEAGQMSLANALAMSPAARSLVLLGDPQQLEQPVRATHPDDVAVSALEHMLAGHATIPADRGVFLPRTWRLCPTLASFTSEGFYESRLASMPGLDAQRINAAGALEGSGLRLITMPHDGNRTWSAEEADVVADIVARLTAPGVTWTDQHGATRPLAGADILVVAPYNAHVSRLERRLAGTAVRVGTVDKFQGQEAAVAIYSMATSRPEDAPRGLEFLYSLNRLNVATSRARCLAIVVASDRLLDAECRTPRQMRLVNALCRFREMAT